MRRISRLCSRGLMVLLAGLLSGTAAQSQILTRNLIYNTTQPCRVLDTRVAGGILAGGTSRTFNIVGGNVTATTFTGQGGTNGGCSLPGFAGFSPKVQAVVIVLTSTSSTGPGFLVAYPSDQAQPATAVLNYAAGQTVANTVVVPVRQDTQGADITVVAGVSSTHVIGDVMGYFSDDTTTSSNSIGNVILGKEAGPNLSTGFANTGIGVQALHVLSVGSQNVAVGGIALHSLVTGSSNVGLGYLALGSVATGSGNIGIGLGGGASLTGSNNIAIGNSGTSADNGVIRIGTAGTQTSAFIAGINGVASSSGTAVYINSSGQLGTTLSSLRFKEGIADIGPESGGLLDLRPVSFYYKPEYDDGGRVRQYGLVAEEVAKVYPGLVQYDGEGKPLAVRYQFLNALLLHEVQSQHREIEQLRTQIEELRSRMGELKP